MFFVVNRKPFWEAGILPTELLPLNSHRNLNKKRHLSTRLNFANLRIPDSTTKHGVIDSKDETQRIRAARLEKKTVGKGEHHSRNPGKPLTA
jgi:hypothetical protein